MVSCVLAMCALPVSSHPVPGAVFSTLLPCAPLPCITVLAVWSRQVCGQPSYCLSFITSGGTAQKPHVL